MTDKDLEYMLDNLRTTFNASYEAIAGLMQKQINCPLEIDKLIRGAKINLDTFASLTELAQDKEWQAYLQQKNIEKRRLLEEIESQFLRIYPIQNMQEEKQTHYL